eukprot:CAMPEP_0203775438 /NCGR_PEP_ID=MMETSP0099_2-20121227/6089_1 /ASSEMBLY_ACC=CAM_ASM_000209 /TAXON_ID=96639 /ORGANISM=" , Strain NY0313808BC1" /LENGTH=110 /DNA_ID=CAMNT_0050674131 /DNA_START=23 /DNA_END=355 /DNA_ORIENTATION=-
MKGALGPIGESIQGKLSSAFSPVHLEVLNESHSHNVPKGSETHFKVVVVSGDFEDVGLLQRHRKVNAVLDEELKVRGVHALSIVAKTPEQWEKSGGYIEPSPNCRGGSKR